jgi:hypothetical protein
MASAFTEAKARDGAEGQLAGKARRWRIFAFRSGFTKKQSPRSLMKKRVTARKQRPQRQLKAAHYVDVKEGEDPAAALAQAQLSPFVQAAYSVLACYFPKALDVTALALALEGQSKEVSGGDMTRVEAILIAQEHTLDAMFGRFARMAVGERNLPQFEAYMRCALRAQAQCARTLEVLGDLKNPSAVAFVRQANIGQAVQVNNESRARAAIPEQPNELLEVGNGKRLDSSTQCATSGPRSQLAPMGSVDRPKNGQW